MPENDYEAKGSVKIPHSNGPFKGRLNASAQVNGIELNFKNLNSNFSLQNYSKIVIFSFTVILMYLINRI